jgi:hypothetical protein
MNKHIVLNAQRFAARWGFLTRDLFYDFLCPMSPIQRYRYWRHLKAKGYFVESDATNKVLLLSRKSREVFKNARPSKLPHYIEHDSATARLFLLFENSGLIARYWLHDELKDNPIEGYTILGARSLDCVPDLVVDLKSKEGNLRMAIESEVGRGSHHKQRKLAGSYKGHSKVQVVIFISQFEMVEAAIKKIFTKEKYPGPGQALIFTQLQDLEVRSLEASIRVGPNQYSLRKLLEIISGKPVESDRPGILLPLTMLMNH